MSVILVLTLILPGTIPDVEVRKRVDTLEQCMAEANKFVRGDATAADGIGLAAGCIVINKHGRT